MLNAQEPFVAEGPCPSCGVENKVFFGDVFGVKVEETQRFSIAYHQLFGRVIRTRVASSAPTVK